MIERGEKKEEYRKITSFWVRRLCRGNCIPTDIEKQCMALRDNRSGARWNYNNSRACFELVKFRYGFTPKAMLYEIKYMYIGKGLAKWGAEENEEYFIIGIGKRYEI